MNVMIIPAAGRGTRLDYAGPKLMYPLDGMPLIGYLLARYQPYIDHFVIVINPKDRKVVEDYLVASGHGFELAYQTRATGMLDAILSPMEALKNRRDGEKPEQVWISWCDQVGITEQTAKTMHELFASTENPCLIFPTIEKPEPYIHFQRNEQGEIVRVLHRREGDEMPAVGENDCGLFGLSHRAYFDLLPQFSDFLEEASSREVGDANSALGANTKERNFLPFISWLRDKGRVSTYAARNIGESIGINTVADAKMLIDSLDQQSEQ